MGIRLTSTVDRRGGDGAARFLDETPVARFAELYDPAEIAAADANPNIWDKEWALKYLAELDYPNSNASPPPSTLKILDGSLADRRAETAQRRAAAAGLWTSAAGHAAITVHPSLATWLAALRRGSTLPAEPGRPSELLRAALDVLAALPAPGIGTGTLAANGWRGPPYG